MQPPDPTWFKSEFISNIINGLANGVGGALAGGVIGFFIAQRQQRIKLVEYAVSAISLANTQSQAGNILQIVVDREAFEKVVPPEPKNIQPETVGTSREIKDDDGNVIGVVGPAISIEIPYPYVAVESAYAFEIKLRNVGNEDIEKPTIEVLLDNSSKVVAIENEPRSRPDYEIVSTRIAPNNLTILLPYLNKNTIHTISLISVDNKSRDCSVSVRGFGVNSRSAEIPRRARTTHLIAGLVIALVAFVTLIISLPVFGLSGSISWLTLPMLIVVGTIIGVLTNFIAEETQKGIIQILQTKK